MRIRKTIAKLNGTHRIDVMDEIMFEKLDKKTYQEAFQSLKKIELLKADSFEDIIWFLPCQVKLRDLKLEFNIEIYREINLALKGYIIIKRISGTSASVLYFHLHTLKKVILITNGLNNPTELLNRFFLPLQKS